MKKLIPIVILAAAFSGSISHVGATSAGNEFAKELATELVVSVVGSLAEDQMASIFGENKAMPKPLTKAQITDAVDDSIARAKVQDIKSALDHLLSEIQSYPVAIDGDKELSVDAKDRRLLMIMDKAIGVKTQIHTHMSRKNMFELLPFYIQAMDMWSLFKSESGVNLSTQQNAANDITAKLVSALQDLEHFYTTDFIDNGARKCVFKTDKQWWGNHVGNTIKHQYLGKKGSEYSINIKNRFCQTDMDTAGQNSRRYDKTMSKRAKAAYAKTTMPTVTPEELAFKDYSWPTDVPTPMMLVTKFTTIPIVYSHRKKLRYWFVRPHMDNRSNTGGGYDIDGPYHKQGDAEKARIKYAVHNYQQAATKSDPRGMGLNVAQKMACWAKVVSLHGSSDQKNEVSKILSNMSIEASECK